ncbi:hypothetical protein AAY473_038808 [Plecturocebus cupreus]
MQSTMNAVGKGKKGEECRFIQALRAAPGNRVWLLYLSGSFSVTQAGVQWHDCQAIVFLVETGFHHVAQAGLELETPVSKGEVTRESQLAQLPQLEEPVPKRRREMIFPKVVTAQGSCKGLGLSSTLVGAQENLNFGLSGKQDPILREATSILYPCPEKERTEAWPS